MNNLFHTSLHPGGIVPSTFPIAPNQKGNNASGTANASFESHLQKSLESSITFSAHAANRLRQRNISLTNGDLQTLSNAVNSVAEKGGRESLILFKNTAFVVNIPNRTVITAVDGQSMQSNVFTQIDSAVIL